MSTSPPAVRRGTSSLVVGGVWAGAVGLALLGAVATFRRPVAPSVPDGFVTDAAVFTSEALARVAAWTTPVRGGFLLATGLELLALAALLGAGPGRRVLARLGGGPAAMLRGALLAGALAALAALPVRAWVGHVVATDVGLRTGSGLRWVVEWAGTTALRVVLVAVAITAGTTLVRRAPRAWPALLTLVATGAAVVLLLLQPVVTAEFLLRPEPVTDPATLAVLDDVLDRSELDGLRLEVGNASVRTTAVNAFVTGVGPTRTVVLLDTLLDLPRAQVRAVVAHEVAHAEVDDPLRGVLATALVVLPLAVAGHRWAERQGGGLPTHSAQLGAVLVAVLLVGELATAPVVTWQSRRVEAAADARALELTRDPGAAIALARSFVEENLSDPSPPAWVVALGGTHPTPTERIRRAVAAGGAPVDTAQVQ